MFRWIHSQLNVMVVPSVRFQLATSAWMMDRRMTESERNFGDCQQPQEVKEVNSGTLPSGGTSWAVTFH